MVVYPAVSMSGAECSAPPGRVALRERRCACIERFLKIGGLRLVWRSYSGTLWRMAFADFDALAPRD